MGNKKNISYEWIYYPFPSVFYHQFHLKINALISVELRINRWTLYLLWWLTSGERNLGRKAVTLIGVKP